MLERQPKVHSLKCWPAFFRAVKSGEKTFEIRVNDRDYQVGDFLELHKFDPLSNQFTDEPPLMVEVTYALSDQPFVPEGMVCMGIKPAVQPDGCEWCEIARECLYEVTLFKQGDYWATHRSLMPRFCPNCGKRLGE